MATFDIMAPSNELKKGTEKYKYNYEIAEE